MSRWRRQQRKRARLARESEAFWADVMAGLEAMARESRLLLAQFRATQLRHQADRIEREAARP